MKELIKLFWHWTFIVPSIIGLIVEGETEKYLMKQIPDGLSKKQKKVFGIFANIGAVVSGWLIIFYGARTLKRVDAMITTIEGLTHHRPWWM